MEKLGAGSGAEGVEAFSESALELIGLHGWRSRPRTVARLGAMISCHAKQAESPIRLRSARPEDGPFLVEMARHVCTLEGRPLPAADDPQVVGFLPDSADAAIVAVEGSDRRLGAVWWVLRDPPLLRNPEGSPLPELAIAVVEGERGKGIGRALLDALVERARGRFPSLVLNVHLLNPAVRLYMRAGFKVAAAGRGWYGVAMSLPLDS